MPLENMNAFLGAAVIGVIGAAGIYIFEQYRQQKNQVAMARDLARLDNELCQVKRELELLLKQKHEKLDYFFMYYHYLRFLCLRSFKSRRNKNVTKANSVISNSTTDDYLSASNLDSSDLEFYDVSDHESDTIEEAYPSLENVYLSYYFLLKVTIILF